MSLLRSEKPAAHRVSGDRGAASLRVVERLLSLTRSSAREIRYGLARCVTPLNSCRPPPMWNTALETCTLADRAVQCSMHIVAVNCEVLDLVGLVPMREPNVTSEEPMAVTHERFAQGLTYDQFKAQMTRNQERFEENERQLV